MTLNRNRLTRLTAVCFSGLIATLLVSPVEAAGWSHDFESAQAESRRTGRPLLVHVHAEWCGPCRAMDARTLHRPEVSAMLSGPVVGVLVNSDHHQDIVRRLGVTSLPSDVLIDSNGRELFRSSGFKDVNAYVTRIGGPAQQSYAMNRPAPRRQRPEPEARPKRRQIIASNEHPANRSNSTTQAETASAGDTVPLDMVAPPMLRGFSAVALSENREWIKGSREFAVDYRGQTYLMASRDEADSFRANPRRYTPRLLGCDAVIFSERDRAVKGRVEWAAFFGDELYLFSTEENRRRFKESPERFVSTRVVQLNDIERVVR